MAKMSRKQRVNKALNRAAATGPFQWAEDFTDAADGSTMANPFRSTQPKLQETTHGNWFGVIDAEHARSLAMGRQTASQFGHGVYDLKVFLRPSTAAVSPASTGTAIGHVRARWFHPTSIRADALRALKGLEALEDRVDGVTGLEGSDPAPGANVLLSIDMETPENSTDDADSSPVRGSRIIRFGFSGDTPKVCRQSSFTMNLNPWSDGDVNDNWENQAYVLANGDSDHFGIMQRMEHAVNPFVSTGQRAVVETWAHPTSDQMVQFASSATAPIGWGVGQNQNGQATHIVAEFRGIRALGGLIRLEFPEFESLQGLLENNDFDVVCQLNARSWSPL